MKTRSDEVVSEMKALRKLRPLVAVVLFSFVQSCEETLTIDLPPGNCENLFAVAPKGSFEPSPFSTEPPIVLSLGGSRKLWVRIKNNFPGGRDRYEHCPAWSLDEFVWTVDDPSVVRVEGSGEEVTVTGLAVGRTTLWVRYDDYDYLQKGYTRIRQLRGLQVVASQGSALLRPSMSGQGGSAADPDHDDE